MKVYYLQNENMEIIQDDFEKFNDGCLEKDRTEYHIKNGYNGALFFEEYMETDEYKSKAKAYEDGLYLKELRQRRETECFSVVNRGSLWYERLTVEQKEHLSVWYQAWLDVTDTLIIPEQPSWLETITGGGNDN